MVEEIKGADVLIVGGGVIGCALARELARRGLEVVVLERGRPGTGATWAAAGMLTPQGEGRSEGTFLELCLSSLSMYPAFAEAVQAETGYDPGFRPMGTLVAALSAERATELRQVVQGREGHPDWLDASTIREIAPALSSRAVGGFWFPREGQVDNRALGRALWSAAELAGARVLCDSEVSSLLVDSDRVTGVRLTDARTFRGERVVIAGGAWSARIQGLPRPLPIRPVRGQMLALDAVPPPLSCLLSADDVYLVPRAAGRVLVGATLEEAGFADHPTARGIGSLLTGAMEAVPSLSSAALVEIWAGLRPGTPDGRPILGPDPDLDGLVYATGHFRNGILLTPVTARLVADVLTGEKPEHDLAPYDIARF